MSNHSFSQVEEYEVSQPIIVNVFSDNCLSLVSQIHSYLQKIYHLFVLVQLIYILIFLYHVLMVNNMSYHQQFAQRHVQLNHHSILRQKHAFYKIYFKLISTNFYIFLCFFMIPYIVFYGFFWVVSSERCASFRALDNKSINNENINYKKATYFIKHSIKSDLKQQLFA